MQGAWVQNIHCDLGNYFKTSSCGLQAILCLWLPCICPSVTVLGSWNWEAKNLVFSHPPRQMMWEDLSGQPGSQSLYASIAKFTIHHCPLSRKMHVFYCFCSKNINHCERLLVDSIIRLKWGDNLTTTPTKSLYLRWRVTRRVTRQSLDHLIFKTHLWLDLPHCVPEEGRQLYGGPSRALVLASLLTPMLVWCVCPTNGWRNSFVVKWDETSKNLPRKRHTSKKKMYTSSWNE